MTILVRVRSRDFDLTVCGTPSKEWLDWLATTTVPLTADQMRWRRPPGHGSEGPEWSRQRNAPRPRPPASTFDLDDAVDDGEL